MCIRDSSKGIIYHYFADKEELYVICVAECFNALTSYLTQALSGISGSVEQRLRDVYKRQTERCAGAGIYQIEGVHFIGGKVCHSGKEVIR